jgi:predicted XRE-type DNA-binding protein
MSKRNEGKNVYAELGFPDAAEMLVKAKLVVKIAEILRERGWSQQEAAKVLGLTQPKLSKMLRGRFRGISDQDDGMPCAAGARGEDCGGARSEAFDRAAGGCGCLRTATPANGPGFRGETWGNHFRAELTVTET